MENKLEGIVISKKVIKMEILKHGWKMLESNMS